jgi:hypothetical protein
LYKKQQGIAIKLHRTFWLLAALGFTVMLYTFMADSAKVLIEVSQANHNFDILRDIRSLIPKQFNWPFYLLGEAVVLGAVSTLIKKGEVKRTYSI